MVSHAVSVCLLALAALCSAQFSQRDALLIIDVQNDFMEEVPVRRDVQPNYPLPR
jgi:hypothetical protein